MTHTLTQKYILFLILLYTKRNLKYFLDFSKDRFHPHSIVTTPPSLYLTTWRIYTGGWLRDWGSWLDSKWQTPVSCETVTGEWRVMAAAESWSTDWAVFCLLDWSELTVQCLAGRAATPPSPLLRKTCSTGAVPGQASSVVSCEYRPVTTSGRTADIRFYWRILRHPGPHHHSSYGPLWRNTFLMIQREHQ